MNQEEAKTLLEIMTSADGGCPYCVSGLFHEFQLAYPQFRNLVYEVFDRFFPEPYIEGKSISLLEVPLKIFLSKHPGRYSPKPY